MKRILACFAACIVLVNAHAQRGDDHIETDRPSETETPHLVKLSYFQIESGILHKKTSASARSIAHPTTLIKYGLSKRFELRLHMEYATRIARLVSNDKTTRGIEPVEAGFRSALWEEKGWLPKTSIVVQAAIPTLASKEYREKHLAPEIRLAMKNTITDGFSVSYNAGTEWDGTESTPGWLYTLTPEFDLGKHLFVFAEVFSRFKKHESPQHTVDGGVEYFINNDFVLDIASGVGLNKAATRFFVTLGGSIRFR